MTDTRTRHIVFTDHILSDCFISADIKENCESSIYQNMYKHIFHKSLHMDKILSKIIEFEHFVNYIMCKNPDFGLVYMIFFG